MPQSECQTGCFGILVLHRLICRSRLGFVLMNSALPIVAVLWLAGLPAGKGKPWLQNQPPLSLLPAPLWLN
jgi:hypothetical protein